LILEASSSILNYKGDIVCIKVDYRIECLKCKYPPSEARWPDTEPPLPCDAEEGVIDEYVSDQFDKYER